MVEQPKIDERTLIDGGAEEGEEATPAKPQYKPPYAVVVEGPRTGARFPLSEDSPNIVGRSIGNAIRLEDQSVSRQHAEITKTASGWTVKDLGSKNGTVVNGKLITEPVVIGHKDLIKVGIYHLRLITQQVTLEEELTLPANIAMADRTMFVASPPESHTAEVLKKDVKEETSEHIEPPKDEEAGKEIPKIEAEEDKPPVLGFLNKIRARLGKRELIMLGVLAVAVAAIIIYFAADIFMKPAKVTKKRPRPPVEQVQKEEEPKAQKPEDALTPSAGAPVEPEQPPPQLPPQPSTPPPPQPPVEPVVKSLPIFLDIVSSPMPAKVTFQGKDMGVAPVRVNVELETGRAYQLEALFEMKEMNQKFVQTTEFAAEKDKSVIPILFRAPIGTLKIIDIPRDVQFYLEGRFSYDKFGEQTAKLTEYSLQKPIYIPFGKYILELKRSKQLGASSQTFVPDLVYRREFTLADDSPQYVIDIKDEDLKIFPAKVRTDPLNANVYIDSKLVGTTPFEGTFPLGEHRLTLRKDGYFEHNEDLKVDINTPYIADIKLKTSVAGAHLNNAKIAINRGMYQDAVNELAEALSSQPVPSEVGLANYLLGKSYYAVGDVERAISYFTLAKADEYQKALALAGLAACYYHAKRMDLAVPALVEALLYAKDEESKREAHTVFQQISPLRSILYIYSDPPGAQVVVNDRPVAQPTPTILHELPLGAYRIRVQKTGYLPTDLNLNLSVNEFNPIIVKLKPIPQ